MRLGGVCGIILFLAGLVLLAIGIIQLPEKLLRDVIAKSIIKLATDPTSTPAPYQYRDEYRVWNYTNLDKVARDPTIAIEIREVIYPMVVVTNPAHFSREFTKGDQTIARTRTINSTWSYAIPDSNNFFTDQIVTINQARMAALILSRDYFIAVGFSPYCNATLFPMIADPTKRATLCSSLTDRSNVATLLRTYTMGGSVVNDPAYQPYGIDTTNEDRVISTLNSFAAQAGNSYIPAGEFVPTTPAELFLLATGNCTAPPETFTTIQKNCPVVDPSFYTDVNTGSSDQSLMYRITSLNGSDSSMAYLQKERVTLARTGTGLGPNQDLNTALQQFLMWNNDLQRVMPFELVSAGEAEVFSVPVNRYRLGPSFMESARQNPDNIPYGVAPSGMVGIWAITHYLPYFLSNPHMFQSDPALTARFTGYAPDPAKHSVLFDIEPISGLVIHGQGSIQLNLRIDNGALLDNRFLFDGTKPLYLPISWKPKNISMGPTDADKIRSLASAVKGAKIGGILLIVAGAILILPGMYMMFKRPPKRKPIAIAQPVVNPHQIIMQTAQPVMMAQPVEQAPQMVMGVDQNGNQVLLATTGGTVQPAQPIANVLPQYR